MNIPENWSHIDNKLQRNFKFSDFSEAFGFLTRVAILAEKHNHHPEIFNVWSKVELKLSTHDAGDVVTEKDLSLARDINLLV